MESTQPQFVIRVRQSRTDGRFERFDLTEALNDAPIDQVQEMYVCEESMKTFVFEMFGDRLREAGYVEENAIVYGRIRESYDRGLTAYLFWRIKEYVKDERERAEKALTAYDEAGGQFYVERGGVPNLCVNVKVYENIDAPPEFKDDEEKFNMVCEWERDDFWNSDLENERVSSGGEHPFPKTFSAGRSGGYVIFDGHTDAGKAYRAWVTGDTDDAVMEWDSTVDLTEPTQDSDILLDAYDDMAKLFESATNWVEFVNACKEDRIKNVRGERLDWLQLHIDNERYEFFDYDNCTITADDGEYTISWPQHRREFDDAGDWVDCDENDEGAMVFMMSIPPVEMAPGVFSPGVGPVQSAGFHKWVPAGPVTFGFTVNRETLVEILAPEIVSARSALAALGGK